MDLSNLIPPLAGVVGGIIGELSAQNRVTENLQGGAALSWGVLGARQRYAIRRDLRRGRVIDDPELGAQVAHLMSDALRGRAAIVFSIAFAALFLALGVAALAHERLVLAAFEIAVAAIFVALMGQRRRVRRRLAEAEQKNRAAAGG